MNITDMLVAKDLSKLNKPVLKEICQSLEIDDGTSAEMASAIWNEIDSSQIQRDKLDEYSNKILATSGSVSYFILKEGNTLEGLSQKIEDKEGIFTNRKELDRHNLSNTPKVFAGHEINDIASNTIIRLAFTGSTYTIFDMENRREIPRVEVATVVIDEEHGILEVRTSRNYAERVAAATLSYLIENDKIEFERFKILSNYNNSTSEFAEEIDGVFKETIEVPEQIIDDMDEEKFDATADILKKIDDAVYSEADEPLLDSIQTARIAYDDIDNQYSFLAIVLAGLGKLNLGANSRDVRNAPLYETLKDYLTNQGGLIDYEYEVDGNTIKNTIQIGLTTDTINFSTNTTEELMLYIKEKLFKV